MTDFDEEMQLVKQADGYKFFKGIDCSGKPFYNVIPENFNGVPTSGYYSSDLICDFKKVKNYFKEGTDGNT